MSGKWWKYAFFPNVISFIVGYEFTPLPFQVLFNLDEDWSEQNNLFGSTLSKVAAVRAKALSLVAEMQQESLPSPLDVAGGVFVGAGPTPSGCWIPLNSPFNTTDCGLTGSIFLLPKNFPLPPETPTIFRLPPPQFPNPSN